MTRTADLATWYRTALLLGLESGPAVIRWAEALIDEDPLAPGAIFDVALTDPADLTALRFALQPMAHPVEPPAVTRAVFDRLRADLASGRRGIGDTVTVLSQIRRGVAVGPSTEAQLDRFEDDWMLAVAGVTGAADQVAAAMTEWLGTFEGAEEALTAGVEYRRLEFGTVADAAAFAAALARVLDSPQALAIEAEHAQLWVSARTPGAVGVFLTPPALALASEAFSPLPPNRPAEAEELPVDAVLVADGARPRRLGQTEVEALLTPPVTLRPPALP